MQSKWHDTLSAIDRYTADLRRANLQAHLLVATFATEDPLRIERDEALAVSQPLSSPPLSAYFSGTPLYDAIKAAGQKLHDLDPPRATILIVTDGAENGSHYTTLDQARAILDWMRAKSWQVVFMG